MRRVGKRVVIENDKSGVQWVGFIKGIIYGGGEGQVDGLESKPDKLVDRIFLPREMEGGTHVLCRHVDGAGNAVDSLSENVTQRVGSWYYLISRGS